MTENCVIGRNNKLPWSLPDDWSRLLKLVYGKDIVMGRKTAQSHEAFLSEGRNYVVSQSLDQMEGCIIVKDIEDLFHFQENDLYILGGSDIYRYFLPHATHMFLTLIHTTLEGDAYFPAYSEAAWKLVNKDRRYADDRHEYDFSFLDYSRI